MHRFFVEGRHQTGDVIALQGSDAHKITNVLRLRAGDRIEVIDSAAQRFTAALQLDGRTVNARLEECTECPSTNMPDVTIAQGVPKGQKMDFVVEKLTELGVASIVPLYSERTIVADVSPSKLERWRRLAKSAAQQSGRSDIAQVKDPLTLRELIDDFKNYDRVLLPWELAERTALRDALPALLQGVRRILVIIGPEGGISHGEAMAARDAGAHLISLGDRILRTETAGLVMLSVIAYGSGG